MVYIFDHNQQRFVNNAHAKFFKKLNSIYIYKQTVHYPSTSTTEVPYDGSGDDGNVEEPKDIYPPESETPRRQGCRADDVVTCPEDNTVHICEVQLCDGRRDCPLGYDEHNCTVGRKIGIAIDGVERLMIN